MRPYNESLSVCVCVRVCMCVSLCVYVSVKVSIWFPPKRLILDSHYKYVSVWDKSLHFNISISWGINFWDKLIAIFPRTTMTLT